MTMDRCGKQFGTACKMEKQVTSEILVVKVDLGTISSQNPNIDEISINISPKVLTILSASRLNKNDLKFSPQGQHEGGD